MRLRRHLCAAALVVLGSVGTAWAFKAFVVATMISTTQVAMLHTWTMARFGTGRARFEIQAAVLTYQLAAYQWVVTYGFLPGALPEDQGTITIEGDEGGKAGNTTYVMNLRSRRMLEAQRLQFFALWVTYLSRLFELQQQEAAKPAAIVDPESIDLTKVDVSSKSRVYSQFTLVDNTIQVKYSGTALPLGAEMGEAPRKLSGKLTMKLRKLKR